MNWSQKNFHLQGKFKFSIFLSILTDLSREKPETEIDCFALSQPTRNFFFKRSIKIQYLDKIDHFFQVKIDSITLLGEWEIKKNNAILLVCSMFKVISGE